jgi:hypothetical protein
LHNGLFGRDINLRDEVIGLLLPYLQRPRICRCRTNQSGGSAGRHQGGLQHGMRRVWQCVLEFLVEAAG